MEGVGSIGFCPRNSNHVPTGQWGWWSRGRGRGRGRISVMTLHFIYANIIEFLSGATIRDIWRKCRYMSHANNIMYYDYLLAGFQSHVIPPVGVAYSILPHWYSFSSLPPPHQFILLSFNPYSPKQKPVFPSPLFHSAFFFSVFQLFLYFPLNQTIQPLLPSSLSHFLFRFFNTSSYCCCPAKFSTFVLISGFTRHINSLFRVCKFVALKH